jgi:hypothetical protein
MHEFEIAPLFPVLQARSGFALRRTNDLPPLHAVGAGELKPWEEAVNQCIRCIVLICLILLFALERPTGSLARECREIRAGWWHNQPVFGTKFSKQHFNECARKYRKENWKVFDVSGPNCQPSRASRFTRPEIAVDECGGDGGDPDARFLCTTQATTCSPRY